MVFNKSPLPFQGQKKNFIKDFKEILKYHDYIVDLFGGSGLLSEHAAIKYPHSVVKWNDYDNFIERLQNIPKTNELILKINEIIGDLPKLSRIPGEKVQKIKDLIEKEEYVDAYTLGTKYVFGLRFINTKEKLLKQKTWYLKSNSTYIDALKNGYLERVSRVNKDFYDLFLEYKDKNVLFIVDPPYENTNSDSYKGTIDYNKLKEIFNYPFIAFSSHKTNILDLIPKDSNIKEYNIKHNCLEYKDYMIWNSHDSNRRP